jgi:signal transduction protein with GAF and PtsI domain
MTASSIGPVKAMILALEEKPLRQLMDQLIAQNHGADHIRDALRSYAEAKGVPL